MEEEWKSSRRKSKSKSRRSEEKGKQRERNGSSSFSWSEGKQNVDKRRILEGEGRGMCEEMGAQKSLLPSGYSTNHFYVCISVCVCMNHWDVRHDRKRNRKGGGFDITANSKSIF